MDRSKRHGLRRYRNFVFLLGTTFCVSGGFGVQIPLFANFIYEKFGIRTHEYGYLEALRETPGLLAAFFSALTMLVVAPQVGMVSLVIMGVGFAAYAWIVPLARLMGDSPLMALIVTSVFWSIGFHSWAPIEGTLSLRYTPAEEKGRWLGWIRTTAGIGQISLMTFSLIFIRWFDYEGMFLIAGGLIVLGGILIGLTRDRTPLHSNAKREQRILLHPRYAVYYVLNFLQGARKQLFLMFAVWLLVKEHGTSREVILSLMIVNQVLSLLTAPTIGRLVDRFGERATLMASHGALIFVMGSYAFITSTNWLYALYVLDSFLFVGGIALSTYLNKIAPREELRPTITMGVTINHIPSVLVPLLGGLAWETLGAKAVFLTGAVLAFAALVATLWVRPETQSPAVALATESAD